MIDEPTSKALRVGYMWDGSQVYTGCYRSDSTQVDSTGRDFYEVGRISKDASFGVELLKRIGLSSAHQRSRSWKLEAKGARVMYAPNLSPAAMLGDCRRVVEAVPEFPAIVEMIGFDTLKLSGRDSSGQDLRLSPLEVGNFLRITGAHVTSADSLSFAFVQTRLWVGYHLTRFKLRKQQALCRRRISLRWTTSCKGQGFVFGVSIEQLPSGAYSVEVIDNTTAYATRYSDTLRAERVMTFGSTPKGGTAGEWFQLTVAPTESPVDIDIDIVRRVYTLDRLTSEKDRDSWERLRRHR